MSTLKVTNLQHASSGSASITLDSGGTASFNSKDVSGIASINGGQIGGSRNLIINGDFSVSQRGNSFTTDNVYTIDRWYSGDGSGGSPARTLSQETFTLGQTDVPGAYYYLRHNQTGASTNGNASLVHKVEDVTRFDGQTVTFSFYAKADAAMDVDFRFTQDFGTGGSPSADVTVTDSLTLGTTWQRYTITKTLGSLSGKTLGTDGVQTSFFRIVFDLTPTTTFTFDLALCQLEYGSQATSFEHRPFGDELQRCFRYYYKRVGEQSSGTLRHAVGILDSATQAIIPIQYPVPMRAVPSFSSSGAGDFSQESTSAATVTGFVTYSAGTQVYSLGVQSGSVGTKGYAVTLRSGTASAFLAFDAEL